MEVASLTSFAKRLLSVNRKHLRFFYMHIGKTAGSAVNHMLREHFGSRFVDHIEVDIDWKRRISEDYECLSGHLHFQLFKQAANDKPFRYITVLREPISQTRSHLHWLRLLGTNLDLRKDTPPHILKISDALVDVDLNDPNHVYNFLMKQDDTSVDRVRLLDNGQSRYFLPGYTDRRFDHEDLVTAIRSMAQFDFVGVHEDTVGVVAGLKKVLMTDADLRLPYANVQEYDRKFDRETWRKTLGDWIGYDCALYEVARIRAGH
ncbi:hypothetical protein ACWGTI_08005 [Mesorhizobium sp. ArgA1]